MRRIKRALAGMVIAAWLAVHVWLWTVLPPVPRWTGSASVRPFIFSADVRHLTTAMDEWIQVWEVSSGRLVAAQPWPPGTDPAASLDADGRHALCYKPDANAPVLLDLKTGATVDLPAYGFNPLEC